MRRLRKGLLLAFVALLGIGAGAFVGAPGAAERMALTAISRVESRLGVRLSAAKVDWTWGGRIVATDVDLRTTDGQSLATVRSAVLELDVSLVDRRVRVVSIALDNPHVHLVRHPDGRTNISAILDALARRAAGPQSTSGVRVELADARFDVSGLRVSLTPGRIALPLSLEVPERIELSSGRVTIDATGDVSRLSFAFADTSLDPGHTFTVDIELSERGWLGPAIGSLGRIERVALTPQRPVRFWLAERVVGVGGVAVSRRGFELFPLQLSVPVDRLSPNPSVSAAATVDRVIIGLSELDALLDPKGLTRFVERLQGGGADRKVAAAQGQRDLIDQLTLQHPVIAFAVDADGKHSFSDLALLLGGLGRTSHANGDPAPSPVRVAVDPGLALVSANVAATSQLLARPNRSKPTPKPNQAELARTVATALGAFAEVAGSFKGRVDRLVTRLDSVNAIVKRFGLRDAELSLAVGDLDLTLSRVDLDIARSQQTQAGADTSKPRRFLEISLDNPWRDNATTRPDERVTLAIDASDGPQRSITIAANAFALPLSAFPVLARRFHLAPTGHLDTLRVSATFADERLEVVFDVALSGLTFQHSAVAAAPLTGIAFKAQGVLEFDVRRESLAVSDLVIELGANPTASQPLRITGSLDIISAMSAPRLKLDLRLADTPVQRVVAAFPDGFIPMLRGLRVDGELGWDLVIDLDTTHLAGLRIDSRPRARQLRVTDLGQHLDFNALRGSHPYTIRLFDGSPGTRVVGPATASWVPLANITPYLPLVLTTTEDGTFYTNDGISTFAMRESIATNLERGSFVRGASTITQQLVKNLYLGGDKTLSRKLQEIFIAWQMAQNLSKDEVMAIYLNTIEFGPGLYGIGDAAWHWFGKRPIDLSLAEAVFLASIIPGPRRYYTFFEQGQITPRWRSYIEMLMRVMVDRKRITADELAGAIPAEVHFRGSGGGYRDVVPADFDAIPERDELDAPRRHVDDDNDGRGVHDYQAPNPHDD